MTSARAGRAAPLHLAVALDGAGWHPAAWREADAQPQRLFTAGYWTALAQQAERGLLDFLTIEDGLDLQSDDHFQAAPDPVQARVGLKAVVGLQVQPVLDGEEVQQAALGLLSQLGPVAGGEQPLRLRVGLAPRGGMPASAVKSNRQVQGGLGGHHDLRSGSYRGQRV